MTYKILITCFVLFTSITACDKMPDEPVLSGENDIVSLTVNNNSVAYTIDQTQRKVFIQLPGFTVDINNMNLNLVVSPRARIPFGYTNFSIPQVYTIEAENGTQKQYTIIVSQVNMYRSLNNAPGEPINIVAGNCIEQSPGFLRMNLGCGYTDPATGQFRSAVLIDFLNQTPATLQTGNWQVGTLPNYSVSTSFGIGNFSSLQNYNNPVSGSVSITNIEQNTCSGSISNATFNLFNPPTGEYYYLFGTFYNIPLE